MNFRFVAALAALLSAALPAFAQMPVVPGEPAEASKAAATPRLRLTRASSSRPSATAGCEGPYKRRDTDNAVRAASSAA